MINAGLSLVAAMQAVYNAGVAASTSAGTGFYGSAYVDITKLKSTTNSEYAQSIASNLQSGSDVSLASGNGDINIKGSNVSSTNGNLNLTTMLGNINLTAGENTYSQESKTSSRSLGGSAGTNGVSANIGFSQSDSSTDYTTYTNSTLTASNGSINLNSKADTTIYGANLLAQNTNLTVGGDLTVKSRQNLLESDSYAIGASIGLSGSSSDVSGASAGFNTANGYESRAWVDNLTSIIGTNSVTINTTNNTNLTGAMIANITNYNSAILSGSEGSKNFIDGANLTLNTGSLTFSDLKNYNNSESNSINISSQFGLKPNDPSSPDKLQLNLSLQGSDSSSNTKATIGNGSININGTSATDSQTTNLNRDITNTEQNKKTIITSDFKSELTIPTMMLTNPTEFVNQVEQGAKLTSDVLFGTNLSEFNLQKTEVGNTSADVIPFTPVWFSRYANENNKVPVYDESGKVVGYNDYPAPNLLPGFGKDPIMGIAHETCSNSACYYLASDQAPLLKAIHQAFPGADSDSAFHDAGKYPNDPIATAITIPPYFLFNKIGAIGTLFDAPNWNQNFIDPKTNIFVKPQPTYIQQNGMNNE